ncbi:transposase, MuDR, MULE transposase domain protein [Tanacetum coccineum]
MVCSVSHSDDEIQALVQKQIDEDMVRQKAILDLALQFDNACTAKEDLRKAYEKCNDIPQESRALIDNFLKELSDKDYELNLSMYRKAAKIEKQINAKLVWILKKYNYRSQTHIGGSSSQTHEICDLYLTEKELHQLHLDEEALRETLEEEARDEKEREGKIRQKQADDEEFFLEFGVVIYDSEYDDDEIQALVQKQIDEDMVRQKAILDLAMQFDNACTAKEGLRKAYEKFRIILDFAGIVQLYSSTRVEPSPLTSNPVRIIPGPAGIVQQVKLLKEKVYILDSDGALMSTQEYMQNVVEDVGEDDDFKSGAWISATNYVTATGGTVTGCLGDINNFLKKGKLDQVVAIVKSCSPNVIDDLTVTVKDLSGTIPGTIHYKVICDGGYGNDITVGAAMILANVSGFTPKPSKHYLNITMRNAVKVFRKDSVPGSGSG